MKVIQAVGWYFPEGAGGTEVYVAALARGLAERGHQVSIAAPMAGAGQDRQYEHEGISVYRYATPRTASREEVQGIVRVRGAHKFEEWLREQRPDVVHFHTFVTGLGIHEVRAAKAVGAKVIVTTHSSSLGYVCQRGTLMRWGSELCDGLAERAKCAACMLQSRGVPQIAANYAGMIPSRISAKLSRLPGRLGTAAGMSHWSALALERHAELFTFVDAFVVLTQWALEALKRNGAPEDKLVLNRLGYSQTAVPRKPPPSVEPTTRPLTVGYLGRYEDVKGVEHFARAIASIPRTSDLRFEFRGPVKTPAEIAMRERLARIVGGDSRVHFAPQVPASEALSVLASYDVLCCPSVCLEGGPTVAIEAHAVGTPVIGSAIGGLAELITHQVNGLLFAPGDAGQIARSLMAIAAAPGETIDEWRDRLPTPRRMAEVVDGYMDLYTKISQ